MKGHSLKNSIQCTQDTSRTWQTLFNHYSITLYLQENDQWSYLEDQASNTQCWSRGTAFKINEYTDHLDANSLNNIWGRDEQKDLSNITHTLTGHFTLIRLKIDTHLSIEFCSDRVRSFPLFYALKGKHFWISDDLLWLKDQLKASFHLKAAITLWRTAQLSSGRDTIFTGIHQLMASEVVLWNGTTLKHKHGFLFEHQEDHRINVQQLKQDLTRATDIFTQRLIHYANGAQIIVPLSGGFDSRLILTALVKAKYPNLLAFTYGRSMTKEVQISQNIAKQLGVKWEFIHYTSTQWESWAESEAGQKIIGLARRSGALYHIQDPMAFEVLYDRGVITAGSIVACGHSGDVHAGSLIDHKSMKAPLTEHGYLALLTNKYYRFNQTEKLPSYTLSIDKVLQSLHHTLAQNISPIFKAKIDEGTIDREAMIDELERWFWRERCAKFLVQSMRCYEAYNLRWWLPLWDAAFTDLWMHVPLIHRGRRGVYHQFVDELFEKVTGNKPKTAMVREHHHIETAYYKRLLLKSKGVQVLRVRMRSPMGWYYMIPFWKHWQSHDPSAHVNAHLMRNELIWWKSESN